MSTILKTLKKLEEDKRLLVKDLNLKELVLQEDQRPPARKNLEIPYKNFMTAGLVLASVIIVVLVFGGRSPSKTEEIPFIQAPSAQAPASINKKGSGPTVGIPLSNIPEQRQYYEEVVSENFPSVSVDEIPPPPVRGIFESAQEPELREINEIRDLIQAATAEAKQPEPYTYPGELVSRGISIPNLRVKGIIFFSSGSPSNHIFVATLESKNRKVRVGDII